MSANAFTYSFRFTHQTDLTGFAGSRRRSGGLAGCGLRNAERLHQSDSAVLIETMDLEGGNGAGGTFLYSTVEGAIIVEYDYTPTPTAPASEPGTLLLLGSGILGRPFACAVGEKLAANTHSSRVEKFKSLKTDPKTRVPKPSQGHPPGGISGQY